MITDLNNVQLNEFMYATFFKDSLLDLTKTNKTISEDVKIDFWGSNEKKIIFIVNTEEVNFFSSKVWKFFNDLLNACYLNASDIALINFKKNKELSYKNLISQFQPKKTMIFGIESKDLNFPFAIPIFQIQNYHEQLFMFCPSLQQIECNKELKRLLWNCLQKVFNIQKTK